LRGSISYRELNKEKYNLAFIFYDLDKKIKRIGQKVK